jgi:hypothetical protein
MSRKNYVTKNGVIYKTPDDDRSYFDLLKDPRWQKKRLEIFQRDEFMCQECFSPDKTLHVHHIKYVGKFPWDTPDLYLVTLCDKCHADEERVKKIDLLSELDDCGLTRESVHRIIQYIAFKVKKYTPEYRSPFWALHNEVLRNIVVTEELDELSDYVTKGIVPPIKQYANGEAA